MNRRVMAGVAIAAVGLTGAWILFIALPRWYAPKPVATAAPAATADPSTPARKITATLFYVSDDGLSLTGVQREVPFGARVAEQARAIVEAQIQPAAPLIPAVPGETKLRNVFVTDRGDAFVDLSKDIVDAHPGGSINELLTIYTIVNALTANMPAIHSVQVLVNGKEVETIAGHVDVRRPLEKNLALVQ